MLRKGHFYAQTASSLSSIMINIKINQINDRPQLRDWKPFVWALMETEKKTVQIKIIFKLVAFQH